MLLKSSNAIGGDMCRLIREVAQDEFFIEKLPFENNRFQHFELSAKLLLIENNQMSGAEPFCDLKKKFLDKLAKDNKVIPPLYKDRLLKRTKEQLAKLNRIFSGNDPLLAKQAAIPVYYHFAKLMLDEYASKQIYSEIYEFLSKFHALRMQNLEKPEEDRDPVLTEFGRLMQQGTNDLNSLKERVAILRRYFLIHYPDTSLRDKKREFSEEERLVLFYLNGKKCQNCNKEFKDISEMEADHKIQWAHGGPTSLKNGRALCSLCNKATAQKVK